MTATILENDLDTDGMTVLDFEPAVPCDYEIANGEHCPNAAEWRCISACCGTVLLFCQKHLDDALDAISEGRLFHHLGGLNACGADDIEKPFSFIERINKSVSGS